MILLVAGRTSSMEGTYRRQFADVFVSSHHHEKNQPDSCRDTASGVN